MTRTLGFASHDWIAFSASAILLFQSSGLAMQVTMWRVRAMLEFAQACRGGRRKPPRGAGAVTGRS